MSTSFVAGVGAALTVVRMFSKQANNPSSKRKREDEPADFKKQIRAKTNAIAAAHNDCATSARIHREQLREVRQRSIKVHAKHAVEVGELQKKVATLYKEVEKVREEKRQDALLQAELLRTQRKRQAGGGGGGGGSIAAAVPDRTKDLNKNEYGAGVYTAINGKLESKGLHAILDTGNANLTMLSQKLAMDLGLITRAGRPNQALAQMQEVRGVVSGSSEQVWQVHAKIVIRTNYAELVPTTLEGTVVISPSDELGCDILVSADHIKELQRRGYGGVRC